MSKSEKVQKVKSKKIYTRMQAEKAMSAGMNPSNFTGHANYHVRLRAWKLMGKLLPEGVEEQNRLLATFQGKEVPKDLTLVPAFMAQLRFRFLGEPLPMVEEVPTES